MNFMCNAYEIPMSFIGYSHKHHMEFKSISVIDTINNVTKA